ncbi:FecR family protein [Parvularcula lutaonensis]|uniref:FecR family protein n=1 Tax=Parvularcula lutaonensis TaxID=491923 RepID=A0ABV7MH53_9PROT|nr:FecR domain-containing protein [Parvularcula lutaonensis]GGY55706.1 sensor [Parvularcula lutaonensis]
MKLSDWQSIDEHVREAALAWHARMTAGDGRADDAAFTDWLTADPAHYDAFALVEAFDSSLDGLSLDAEAEPANDNAAGGLAVPWPALAAGIGIVALGLALVFNPFADKPYEAQIYAETDLERSVTELGDGSRIILAPGSSLSINYDRKTRRVSALKGLAYFDVAGDGRPFIVSLAEGEVRVLGTEFEIRQTPAVTRVGVVEGRVAYEGETGTRIELVPGQLLADTIAAPPKVLDTALETIAPWRDGVLEFDNAPLAEVTAALNTYFGRETFRIAPGLTPANRFSGVLSLSTPAATAQQLSAYFGVDAFEEAGIITLAAPSDPPAE